MEAFPNPPLFDLSQATTFSQLHDDDFLALLQKQFPGSAHNNLMFGGFENSVNPQNLTQYNMPTMSPSSDNTSPSPPNMNKSDHHKDASEEAEDPTESALKRKASDDDFEEGPSSKNQHTGSSRRASTSKRKSSGPDESRALKRKEQNRAAQRAFRERKEKHVRDLEDQVAALEAKNEAATTENENLRDLLTRLQTENMTLRQQASASTFTFTVPKSAAAASPSSVSSPQSTYLTNNASIFSTLPRITYSTPNLTNPNPLDMTSLMSFNPSVLSLLDETPQQTATDGAMNMDIGYNQNKQNTTNNGGWLPSNLTTLATNPAYFSMASMYDSPSPQTSVSASTPASIPAATPTAMPASDQSAFSFDMNSLTQWPTNADGGTLDDLFGGYFNPQPTMDVDMLLRSPPVIGSPVVHQNMHSPQTSASSSPASHTSEPSLFSAREGSSSESEVEHGDECPKSRAELVHRIVADGPSQFADGPSQYADGSPFAEGSPFTNMSCPETFKAMQAGNIVPTEHEKQLMQSVSCRKSTTGFPTTQMNDNNVEVLTAWRSITKDPNFKECDISKLCSEFAAKARCDGTKVVLEPGGVQDIRETLSRKH